MPGHDSGADRGSRMSVRTYRNPDLDLMDDGKPRWNSADHRRHGFHNLHTLARHVISFRAANVLALTKRIDLAIGARPEVERLTENDAFSAMVVARGQEVLFERYAPDFGPDQPHSIMSITKTTLNLIIGRLVAGGAIDLTRTIGSYLPEIGTGYRDATVQAVLNMDVANSYSEDYADPDCSSYQHEAAMGWRLGPPGVPGREQEAFLAAITSGEVASALDEADYKSANTDVLAWVAERVTGRSYAEMLSEIADAMGVAGAFHLTCNRRGLPWASGGGCLTARDLARLGLLFVRGGVGVTGEPVGDPVFIEATRERPGKPMPAPTDFTRYSNQMFTDGIWVGHSGYGGQFMLANLDTGIVAVFLSVLETGSGYDRAYSAEMIRMLAAVAAG